ncbi:MAG: glycosyltransferase, partial [Gammaproteobacteria bacterium]
IAHFSMDQTKDEALLSELRLSGKRVLGFIGSFYAYEGLPLLVEALPAILAEAPDTRLLLVGGGPQEAVIKQKVAALGLEDAVIFTGRVPHAEVTRYYSLVDIFVYPRLSMRLTDLVTPLKPLEAMAQGKLVLASDVGGHRELIRDGENGLLFEAGSKEALARRALELMQDADRWPELRAAGRRYVEEERNWPASVARYESVYRSLLVGGPSGPTSNGRSCRS